MSHLITDKEVEAVRVATFELRGFLDVIGLEADLDDEEMPQNVLNDACSRLERFLARVDRCPGDARGEAVSRNKDFGEGFRSRLKVAP